MAGLGSNARPIRVRVRTMERAKEVVGLCEERGWKVIAGVEAGETEDVEELEEAMRQAAAAPARLRWSPSAEHPAPPGTAPCPCGSGRRYRKCCMKR